MTFDRVSTRVALSAMGPAVAFEAIKHAINASDTGRFTASVRRSLFLQHVARSLQVFRPDQEVGSSYPWIHPADVVRPDDRLDPRIVQNSFRDLGVSLRSERRHRNQVS